MENQGTPEDTREQRIRLLEDRLARLCREQNAALRVGAMDAYFRTGEEIRDLKELIRQEESSR